MPPLAQCGLAAFTAAGRAAPAGGTGETRRRVRARVARIAIDESRETRSDFGPPRTDATRRAAAVNDNRST